MWKRFVAVLCLLALLIAVPCASAEDLRVLNRAEIMYIIDEFEIPDGIKVTGYSCSGPSYWDGGGQWLIYVELFSGNQLLASASLDTDTLEMVRNIYTYSPENVDVSGLVFK